MRFLSAAREWLYKSVTNRYPYNAYHVLNNVVFHGFIFSRNKRFECVVCGQQLSSWGRNLGRACVQAEDLCNLIEHADGHHLVGIPRLPFEEFATLIPAADVFTQLFSASCWDQAVFMTIALKKLAEDAAVREHTFYDNPAALTSLHPQETVEDCVQRGLWYNPAHRQIQCAFCSYATNALGILHKDSHSDYTRCPRLLDCAPETERLCPEAPRTLLAAARANTSELHADERERQREETRNSLEAQLAHICHAQSTFPPRFVQKDSAGAAATVGASSQEDTRIEATSATVRNSSFFSAAAQEDSASFYPSTVSSTTGGRPIAPQQRGMASRLRTGKPYLAASPRRPNSLRVPSTLRYSLGRREQSCSSARPSPICGVATRAMTSGAAAMTRGASTGGATAAYGGGVEFAEKQPAQAASPFCCAQQSVADQSPFDVEEPRESESGAELSVAQDDGAAATAHGSRLPLGGTDMLSVWMRLAAEGYAADNVLQILAKRTNEPLTTYAEFKHFEQSASKVRDQDYITLGPTERQCVLCLRSPITTAVDPCGHMQFCASCIDRQRYCPLCKRRVVRKLRIFSPFT